MQIKSLVISTIVLLLGFLASQGQAREFIVLATPQAPHKYEEDGQLKGIDIEVLKLVMERMDLRYRVRLIRSDTRIQAEAQAGRADMLLLFSKKQARMAYLDYPQESYVNLAWHFFVRAGEQNKIQFESLDDLRGLQVGATRDVAYTPEFWDAGLNLQITSSNDLQIRKLIAGRFDIVALNTISTLFEAKRDGNLDKIAHLPKPLKSKAYFNVFPKASNHPRRNEVLQNYDGIIQKLRRHGIIQQIFQKYLGDSYDEDENPGGS